MSDHALFYNSVDHDRVYNADSFSDWLKKFFTTGVFTGDLFVSALSGMNVSVGTGYVNINGKVMIYETATQLTLEPANGIYPRIDTIVVERNDTDRDFNLKVVTGDYANLNDPVPTPPVRSGAIYQLVLAQIYVGAGVTEITQANITDTRADADLCGIVTGTVTEMDFSQFAAQFAAYYQEFKNGYELDFTNWSAQQRAAFDAWMADEQDDFDDWFANLHYILDGDVAGHLQNEIDEIKEGMSGSVFRIHTDESTLIGQTVTVSANGQTATATINNSGDAEVKNFLEVGTVTISATDGDETATSVISVPYFGNYPITLAFWSAVVNIQGDENLYGEDVKVANSAHLVIATITLSSVDGTGVFTATRPDTYEFVAEYEGETYSETLAITEQTTYSVNIQTLPAVPEGATVTPTDVISTWIACAGLDNSHNYTTITEVMADTELFDTLLRDSNACDYMARSTTWASTICNDQDAMTRVGLYDYCCYVLRNNSTWNSAINQSTYSSYIPSNPTGSTTQIHSCPNDTIYHMANGSPVVLATTDANGIGEVDWGELPVGDLTLYSSVAKDPNNLSNDYSKSVRVTKTQYGHTTDAYIMPDAVKTLYWYGYENALFSGIVMTNYRASGANGQQVTPTITRNTNDVQIVITGAATSSQGSAIINNVPLASASSLSVIGSCTNPGTYSVTYLDVASSATISADHYTVDLYEALDTTTSTKTINVSSISTNRAILFFGTYTTATIKALWLG